MFVGTSGTETLFVGTSGTETTKCLLEQVGLRLQSVCWNKWD